MGLIDALRDPQFRRDVGANANQLAQSMSNTCLLYTSDAADDM
jgi:hypothetical protein